MSDETRWMRRAVDLAKNCVPEPGKNAAPKVAAVLVKDGVFVAEAHRGQPPNGAGDHAEFCLLRTVPREDVAGSTVYTTLEPCSRRNPGKTPCAKHLADRGVAEVVIGIFDPNPKIYREGWRMLRDAGIRLRDFPADLRREISLDNCEFLDQFRAAPVSSGKNVVFDYTQNGGRYDLGPSDARFNTRWSRAGHDAIHAISQPDSVALARYANRFGEIDDPGALNFSSHSVRVGKGEIAAFRIPGFYALVKINYVLHAQRGDDHYEVSFDFEIRPGK